MHIYIIGSGIAFKIGIAQNVESRLKELQTGNESRLVVVAMLPIPGTLDAKRVEAEIHERYAKKRLRRDGEWFDLSEMELCEICVYVSRWIAPEWMKEQMERKPTLTVSKATVETLASERMMEEAKANGQTVERLTYTADETCALLGISRTTLWRLEKQERLEAIPGLRHKRYSAKSLQAFVESAVAA